MTAVDWGIVVVMLALLPIGYERGLIVGALSLGGFAAGAALGARLAPLLLSGGSSSAYGPALALLGGIVLGAILAVMLEGLGRRLRANFAGSGGAVAVDSVGGAAIFAALGLAIAWVLGAVALNTPAFKGVRDDIQRSVILSAVNDVLPPSGPILHVLNRIDPAHGLNGPSADVGPPDQGIVSAAGVGRASASVVHVLGTACGLNISGSGWVAGPELVVTNAHVLAGEDDTTVTTRDGAEFNASASVYRPDDDIAVLRVPGLGLDPLPIVKRPKRGTSAAVLGYPGAGDFTTAAARLGTTGEVTSQDSYGNGPIQRRMTSFRGDVMSGNSGGPLVDGEGRVLTTVFASALDTKQPEGLGVPNVLARAAIAAAGGQADTGSCS